jgi:RNA polymerase sigma-70 factor (ECF subfamily)
MAESVGMAMLVVLETLTPSERLAFVLHDMFSVPFGEIAEILGQSPPAARQLASRARRKVTLAAANQTPTSDGNAAPSTPSLPRPATGTSRRCSRCWTPTSSCGPTAARPGPQRPDWSGARTRVAAQAIGYGRFADAIRPAVVNGAAGAVVAPRGRPVSVMAFTVRDGRIRAIDVLADPQRLRALGLTSWSG